MFYDEINPENKYLINKTLGKALDLLSQVVNNKDILISNSDFDLGSGSDSNLDLGLGLDQIIRSITKII